MPITLVNITVRADIYQSISLTARSYKIKLSSKPIRNNITNLKCNIHKYEHILPNKRFIIVLRLQV